MAMRGIVVIDTARVKSTSSGEMLSYREIKMLIGRGRIFEAGSKTVKC